jgi:hypothetical protein
MNISQDDTTEITQNNNKDNFDINERQLREFGENCHKFSVQVKKGK